MDLPDVDAAARHDYADQAARYDRTRGASPSILAPVRRALQAVAPGRLLDVAGGTGNYAVALRAQGWSPLVVDVSAAMLARARSKGLATVRADASHLPFGDGSHDALINLSALHLISDWRGALADAQRVLRSGGVIALMVYARENLDVHWIFDYFPETRTWVDEEHQSADQILAALPGASAEPFAFTDLDDASMAALCRHPTLLLDPAWRLQTSYFERLERKDPDALRAGLARLERDLASGRRPDEEVARLRAEYGDGTIIVWHKP